MRYISADQLRKLADRLKTGYGQYLLDLLDHEQQ